MNLNYKQMKRVSFLIALFLLTNLLSNGQSFKKLCDINVTDYTIVIKGDSISKKFQVALRSDTSCVNPNFFNRRAKVVVSYCDPYIDLILAFETQRVYLRLPYDSEHKKIKLTINNGNVSSKQTPDISYIEPPRGKF